MHIVNFLFMFERGALEEYKTKYEFLHSSVSTTVNPKHWNYISGTKYFLSIDAYVTFMKPKGFYWMTVNHIDGNKTIDKLLMRK